MKKQSYSSLVRKHKPEASDFVAEQESVVKLLNSPVRKNWLRIVGLDNKEISKVLKLVDHYARLKVTLENRKKPKSKKDIIAVEDACLRLMFQAKVVDLHNLNTRFEKLKVLKNLLKSEYKDSVILDTYQAEKLSMLSSSKNLASDFLVFDVKKNKIIAVDLEKH